MLSDDARRVNAVLSTGAEMRVTGRGRDVVVCVNGGQAGELEGTWSASLEWLVRRLAPRLPHLRFAEVRYRVKSWRQLDRCVDDARAAICASAASATLGIACSGKAKVELALISQRM